MIEGRPFEYAVARLVRFPGFDPGELGRFEAFLEEILLPVELSCLMRLVPVDGIPV